jgi:hypothetical protein
MTALATASGCSGNRAWLAPSMTVIVTRDPGVGPEDTPLVFGSNGPYPAMISKTGAVPAAQ